MTRHAILAIDAGKSGCRAATYVAGERVAEAEGPGFANVAAADGIQQIHAALSSTLAGLPDAGGYDVACLGMTGVLEPNAHARTVASMVGEVVAVDRVVVTSDVVTTFCGALGIQPGVVVAAGTGAIGLGIGPDGGFARVDGLGYLLDDGGSGFEIGRAGLREALRAMDGRGGSIPLREAALAAYGSLDVLLDTVYGAENPARMIAAFSRCVTSAAEAGDPVARRLLEEAARHLAQTAAAAAGRTFPPDADVPLSWNGGVFRAGDLVMAPFLTTVCNAISLVRPRPPRGDALDGAAELAVSTDPSVPRGKCFAGQLLTVADTSTR